LADALEAGHDRNISVVQRTSDPPRRDVDDARLAVRGVGDDPGLGSGERTCGVAEVGDRHGQEGHRDPLTRGEEHVHLTTGGKGAHLLGQVEQLVRRVAHGGDHDTDLVAGLACLDDPPRNALDALGIVN
jgi:hypothetical protein